MKRTFSILTALAIVALLMGCGSEAEAPAPDQAAPASETPSGAEVGTEAPAPDTSPAEPATTAPQAETAPSEPVAAPEVAPSLSPALTRALREGPQVVGMIAGGVGEDDLIYAADEWVAQIKQYIETEGQSAEANSSVIREIHAELLVHMETVERGDYSVEELTETLTAINRLLTDVAEETR